MITAWLVVFAAAFAAAAPGEELLTRADELRNVVQAAPALSDDQKAQAAARIDETIGFARDATVAAQAKARLRETIDAAPTRLKALKDQLAQAGSTRF